MHARQFNKNLGYYLSIAYILAIDLVSFSLILWSEAVASSLPSNSPTWVETAARGIVIATFALALYGLWLVSPILSEFTLFLLVLTPPILFLAEFTNSVEEDVPYM
jgi:hypothetical protein